MTKRLILIAALTFLCVALSAAAAWATVISPPGEPGLPQPSSGPPGTAVTWTFETPILDGQDGFIPGEAGDILLCSQQLDVGDFNVFNISEFKTEQLPTITVAFTVPEQATPGSCTVRAHGRQSGFEVTADFTVQATAVPYTGGSAKKTLPSWIAYLAGGIMLAVGGVFVWRRTLAP